MISDQNCTTWGSITSLLHPFWNRPNTGLSQFKYCIDAVLSRFVSNKRNRKRFYISFCMQKRKTLMSFVKNSVKRIKGKTNFIQEIREVLNNSEKEGSAQVQSSSSDCVILRWNGSSTTEGFHAVLRLRWKTWGKSWKFSLLKTRMGVHGLMHLTLLLDVINRKQRCSFMLDCNLLIWGFICSVLAGDFVCLISVWYFFISTDDVRRFSPVILVYCCYFTGDITRLTRLHQFWHQCFLMLWLVSFLFVLRQEAMDLIKLPMMFCLIRSLVY